MRMTHDGMVLPSPLFSNCGFGQVMQQYIVRGASIKSKLGGSLRICSRASLILIPINPAGSQDTLENVLRQDTAQLVYGYKPIIRCRAYKMSLTSNLSTLRLPLPRQKTAFPFPSSSQLALSWPLILQQLPP